MCCSMLRVSRHGIEIEIENAEEIPFSEEDIDPQTRTSGIRATELAATGNLPIR